LPIVAGPVLDMSADVRSMRSLSEEQRQAGVRNTVAQAAAEPPGPSLLNQLAAC